jgi:hypothetical protein
MYADNSIHGNNCYNVFAFKATEKVDVGTSSLLRLTRVKKGNSDGATLSQRTNRPLKRKRANGSKAHNIMYGKKNFRK